MKKLLLLITLIFLSAVSQAQFTPTPNVGFEIPSNGSNNWNIPLNYNFNLLDQYLGGIKPIPALKITGNLTVGGSITAGSYIGVGGGTFPTISGTITANTCAYWVTTTTLGSQSCSGSTGTVTNFSAPSGLWPSWLVPAVLNPNTSPQLIVSTTAIPNSALANSSTTVNGQSCILGSTCTIPNIGGYFPGTPTVTVSGAPTTGQVLTATSTAAANWQMPSSVGSVLLSPTVNQTITQPAGTTLNVTGSLRHDGNPLLDSPFNKQVSLGDSITFGAYQVNGYAAYPWIIGNWLNVVPNNLGVSGATCGSSQTLIFSTSVAGIFPQTSAGMISYQIGTNDANLGGVDANQAANYGACISAQGAFLAIPTANKVLATSFTKTGTWTGGLYAPDIATTTPGSTASFSVTGSVIYLATTVSASLNPSANATLTCDGTPTGATLQFTGAGAEVPINSAFTALTRVSGLTNTTHACTVSNTGSAGTVELAWAAGVSGSANPTWPYLFQGGIPDQDPAVPTETNLYRAYIPTTVSTLNGDGLNVFFANTNATLTVPNDYVNQLHPIGHGQYLLGLAFINEIKTVTGAKAPAPIWSGDVLTDTTVGGANNLLMGNGNSNTTLTGNGNTCISINTCNVLSSGTQNTVEGGAAGQNLTTASSNNLRGFQAGQNITSGGGNVVDGVGALNVGTTVTNNVAVGLDALAKATSNTNVAVGNMAGYINTTVAVTTSSSTTFVGNQAGSSQPSATSVSNSGGFGSGALVGGALTYELGPGTCASNSALCFEGFQFLTSAGAGTLNSLALNGSQVLTGAQGTTGVKVAVTSGTFTNGNLRSSNSTGDEIDSGGSLSSLAPLASPALTGTPTAPTATVGTNTTQVATTAFVLANTGSGSITCNANGCWNALPGGWKDEWGTTSITSSGGINVVATITLPSAFTTTTNEVITANFVNQAATNQLYGLIQVQPGGGSSTSTIDLNASAMVANGGGGISFPGTFPIMWRAIGH